MNPDAAAQAYYNLTNHPPSNDDVTQRMEDIRVFAKGYATAILEECPESRERSLAMTNLEQTTMWAIAAIARHQDTALKSPLSQ